MGKRSLRTLSSTSLKARHLFEEEAMGEVVREVGERAISRIILITVQGKRRVIMNYKLIGIINSCRGLRGTICRVRARKLNRKKFF